MEVTPFRHGKCNHFPHHRHLCYRGKGLFLIDTVCPLITLCHKPGLIPINGVVGIVLHFEYPPASDFLLVVWRGDEILFLILGEFLHLLIHCFNPSERFSGSRFVTIFIMNAYWYVFENWSLQMGTGQAWRRKLDRMDPEGLRPDPVGTKSKDILVNMFLCAYWGYISK